MKKYLFKFKLSLIISVIMVIAAAIITIALAFVFKNLIDVTKLNNINKFYSTAIFSFIFIIFGSIINYLSRIAKYLYIKKTMVYLKNDVFNKIINKNIADFTSDNSASYISIITNDLKMIEESYFENIFQLISSFTLFILSIMSLFILSYKIAIILIILSILTVIIPQIFQNKLSKKKKIYSDSLSDFTIKIRDIFTGFEVIKSFKIENKIFNEYSKINNSVESNKYKFNILNSYINLVAEVIGGLMFISIFIIGSYLTLKGEITLGIMVACIQLTNNVVNPVYMCIQYISDIKSMKEISSKILNIYSGSGDLKKYESKESFQNSLIFKAVSFKYEENKPILKDINLEISKGKKYAFVGISGSGKSTILKLLLKQYENYEGKIYIDGTDLKLTSHGDIYNLVSIIHQNVYLFDNTIKENITLFNDYNNDEIISAIKLSGLNCMINKELNGIESMVGENGNLISGGEKQRISIARALIRKSPILVLDEAMASLDNETAYSIENTILNMDNITSIVVTHRLTESLLKKYDKIFTIKDGQIIEEGNFDDLISLNGYFYSLFNIEQTYHK